MSDWRTIDSAPKDGTQFLAALSNGWVVILSEIPKWDRYAWYRCHGLSVPVVRTHDQNSLGDSLIATHWMPLPAPPGSDHDGSR